MNPQQIRFEALKLAVAIDGRSPVPMQTMQLVERAARFADFIQTGKAELPRCDIENKGDLTCCDKTRAEIMRSLSDDF